MISSPSRRASEIRLYYEQFMIPYPHKNAILCDKTSFFAAFAQQNHSKTYLYLLFLIQKSGMISDKAEKNRLYQEFLVCYSKQPRDSNLPFGVKSPAEQSLAEHKNRSGAADSRFGHPPA